MAAGKEGWLAVRPKGAAAPNSAGGEGRTGGPQVEVRREAGWLHAAPPRSSREACKHPYNHVVIKKAKKLVCRIVPD